MPDFNNPFAFLLILLIPLLFILRKLKLFNRISFSAVLADWNGNKFEWKGKWQKFLSVLSKIFLCCGFILVVTAFADPVISHQEKVYTSLGTDVIFVVDTSPSMAARDFNNQMRIEAAMDSIYNLTAKHDGYRFGLVALGSNASVIAPPTNDYAYFMEKLSSLYVGMLGEGSAIGDGLSTAVCHLISSAAPKKCIILLTDGENNAGEIHPETAAKLAAENNITVYVIGIGSKGSISINYTNPNGKQYSGHITSNYNSFALKKIATTGNGNFFEAKTLDQLTETLSTVSKIENTTQTFTYRTVDKLYYTHFLLAAIILLVLAWIIKRIILKEMFCFKLKKVLIVRSFFLGFAFVMLLLAYTGISWGTYLTPVQKTGNSVSMVFDISNSMMANDGPSGISRLEAASIYAKKLLSRMENISTSVVLAKGDGVAAIPLTEDKVLTESLIDVLSPNLMTVPGTSLAKGIIKAKETFQKNYSSAGRIWVFTDGEETDGQLEDALLDCMKSGIPVSIIGFGNNSETEVFAGDGKTKVKTALRTEKIQNTIGRALERFKIYKNRAEISFINSNESGSALKLLAQLNSGNTGSQITTYEIKPVERYKLFLVLAILAFIFSYITTEIDFIRLFKMPAGLSAVCVMSIFLTGCSSNTTGILKGTYSYHKKQYKHAVSEFVKVVDNSKQENDTITLSYSLYNLATAYATLGEEEAAKKRFEEIPEDAPDNVKYAAYYNAGILAHKNADYETAKTYFRKALEIDSSKIEAKINMELSLQMIQSNIQQNESKALPANEHDSNIPDIEKAIFERIKENDQKQWKNSESTQSQNLADDY